MHFGLSRTPPGGIFSVWIDSEAHARSAKTERRRWGVMTSDGMGPKGPGGGLGIDRGLGGEIGDEAVSVIELTGVIKWFDVSKGYGFIVPDNGMPDILLHVTCLRRDGHPGRL